jgi:hypothetical protein
VAQETYNLFYSIVGVDRYSVFFHVGKPSYSDFDADCLGELGLGLEVGEAVVDFTQFAFAPCNPFFRRGF